MHDDDDDDDNDDDDDTVSGSDVFLDQSIHCYLSHLLRLYCRPTYLDRMDFSQPVPGLASFHDLYVDHCSHLTCVDVVKLLLR